MYNKNDIARETKRGEASPRALDISHDSLVSPKQHCVIDLPIDSLIVDFRRCSWSALPSIGYFYIRRDSVITQGRQNLEWAH
jgi:hypothetical protein